MKDFSISAYKKAVADAINSGEATMTIKGMHYSHDCQHKILNTVFDLGEGEKYEMGVWEYDSEQPHLDVTFYSTNPIDLSREFKQSELADIQKRAWAAYREIEREQATKRIKELKSEIERLEALINEKEGE